MSGTYSVGVDLGGTNLRIGSYAQDAGLMDFISLPTRLGEGRERVVRDLCDAVFTLIRKKYGGRELAGVGIGTPGPLELPEGILRNPPNLQGWDGFNLRHAIETTLGRSVYIESDANTAALAEARLGAGYRHRVDSLCVLTLGTGVGSGLILDGHVWHGSTGMGGEAGHLIVKDADGAPCGCGGSGCLEQYASATAVVRMARERMGHEAPSSSDEVFLLASQGEPRALAVFEAVGHSLAVALTGLVNTLNLPLYLLAGGVCEAWEVFAPAMFRELRERSYVYRLTDPCHLDPTVLKSHKTYVLRAELGSNAGLLGACLLPYQTVNSHLEAMEVTHDNQ
jgi:glucokinase